MRIRGVHLPEHDVGAALGGGERRRQHRAPSADLGGDLPPRRRVDLDPGPGGGDGLGEDQRHPFGRGLQQRPGRGVGLQEQGVRLRGLRKQRGGDRQGGDREAPRPAQE